MTTTDTGWAAHAATLVATLTDSGDLRDPAWATAIAATPRHRLVPTAYQQQPDGTWARIDTHSLALAYSPTTLVTEIDTDGRAVSSSTKPDLMVRMLETLDVHDGHRVLEIGTGTGYNAALLTHRLGAENVFSLEVDASRLAATRKRLADIGCHPRLAARDGIDGWPEHAPYHRIIATCSLPRIPWAWAPQLTPGGTVLADLKLGPGAGNLVLLHRYDDRLEGRFTTRWAAFMVMRHDGDTITNRAPKATTGRQRVTSTPAQPWNTHREVWMLACLACPPTSGTATPSIPPPEPRERQRYPHRTAPGARSSSPPRMTAHDRSVRQDQPHSGHTSSTPINTGTSTTSPVGNDSGSPPQPTPSKSG